MLLALSGMLIISVIRKPEEARAARRRLVVGLFTAVSPPLALSGGHSSPPHPQSANRNSDAGDMPRTGDLPFVHTFSTSMDKEAHNEDRE